jgi:sugar phosphate isomerase/epimerase
VLRADNGERNDRLDLSVHSSLLRVILLVLVRVHPDVVESELLLDAVLELLALLESEGVGLCNDRHHVDGLAQLLEDDNVNRLEAVTGGRNEVKTAVDTGVLDIAGDMSVCGITILSCLTTYRSR